MNALTARMSHSWTITWLFTLTLAACGGGGGTPASTASGSASATNPPAATPAPSTPSPSPGSTTTSPPATSPPVASPPPATPQAASFVPLSWPNQEPTTQYTLSDGTLVTNVGGRTRDRHAREQPDAPGTGDPYDLFAAHYFERRSHNVTIYENVSPVNPANRILTLVIRPQWWLYGTNFRQGYIGRRTGDLPGPTAVALYGDNGGVKVLPAGTLLSGQELKTPLANYDALPSDPNSNYATDLNVPPKDGEFVLVKQITFSPALNRNLLPGDLVEFELGIFLAGDKADPNLGRFNYYSDVMVYKVGTPGVHAWFRGPCCDNTLIPWDSHLIPQTALSGGELMTLQEDTSNQPEMNLQQAGTNIAGRNIQGFLEGRRLFHTSFLTGAHTEPGNPVLLTEAGKAGPKFQQAACILCHVNNGKSTPGLNVPLDTMVALTGDNDANGKPVPDSRFGGHLEQGLVVDTVSGVTYDGRQAILKIDTYNTTNGTYPDNTPYSLQTPHYVLTDLAGNPLPLPTRMSVRTAPHLVGMGLLEAVPESAIQALAAAGKSDPDGAVGKLQLVTDLQDPTITRVGRFGWRATTATVSQQTAAALNGDMGVTTTILPHHLCGMAAAGTDCRAADLKGPELADDDLDRLIKYASLLAVPPQRHFAGEQPLGIPAPLLVSQPAATTTMQITAENAMQARVARGGVLFDQARCSACHAPTLTTGPAHRFAELRNQTIHPYTDLLLHDMGAELADNYPQGLASAQEWRTAPLWGLGLLSSINPNVRYLHDGRARSIEEAILWHGGQGAASRDRFKQLSADDRLSLIDFVTSR
jgi:CxxC motif-containing protein (DUF1111 family)